jgi:hypothetical protein
MMMGGCYECRSVVESEYNTLESTVGEVVRYFVIRK